MKILILSIRSHGEEDSVYVFGNENANILPVVKDWLSENGVKLNIPDGLRRTAPFLRWFYDTDNQDVFINTQVKELL